MLSHLKIRLWITRSNKDFIVKSHPHHHHRKHLILPSHCQGPWLCLWLFFLSTHNHIIRTRARDELQILNTFLLARQSRKSLSLTIIVVSKYMQEKSYHFLNKKCIANAYADIYPRTNLIFLFLHILNKHLNLNAYLYLVSSR